MQRMSMKRVREKLTFLMGILMLTCTAGLGISWLIDGLLSKRSILSNKSVCWNKPCEQLIDPRIHAPEQDKRQVQRDSSAHWNSLQNDIVLGHIERGHNEADHIKPGHTISCDGYV